LEALSLVGARLAVARTRETGVVQSFEGFRWAVGDTLVITQDKGRLASITFLIILTSSAGDWTVFTTIIFLKSV
jgi:hypothetical protein